MSEILENIEEQKESFKVKDLESASWCFEKISEKEEEEKKIKEYAIKKIEKIKKWQEEELSSINSSKTYFESLLNFYYREQRQINKKFKLSTPYGKVTSRKSEKMIYEDEEKLIDYLKDNYEAIRVKKELNKTYINNTYKKGIDPITGEILPFVHIEEVESIIIKIV